MILQIISTDSIYLQNHQENIATLVNSLDLENSSDPTIKLRVKDDTQGKDGSPRNLPSRVPNEACEKVMMLKAGLHLADIANPSKPNHLCVYWAKRVTEEFFAQGDKEKARGLAISPLCDRKTSNIEEGQKGFIKFVVQPIFEPWAGLMPEAEITLTHLETNLKFWDKHRNSGFLQKELALIHKEVKQEMEDQMSTLSSVQEVEHTEKV